MEEDHSYSHQKKRSLEPPRIHVVVLVSPFFVNGPGLGLRPGAGPGVQLLCVGPLYESTEVLTWCLRVEGDSSYLTLPSTGSCYHATDNISDLSPQTLVRNSSNSHLVELSSMT